MPYFDHDDVRLFYKDWGSGPPVVFLASAGVSSDFWQYQLLELSERGLRCIAPDRRGHGRSDDPGTGYDYDTLADDLGRVLEHLDLRDATLVGHSMAGGEIVRYLTRHGSDRVARIALVSATLPFPLRTDDNPDGVPAALLEQVRAGWYRDFARWMSDNAPAFFGAGLPGCDASAALGEWAIRDMSRTSLRAIIDCNHATAETDFRAELQEIRLPALVIHGDHDASIPFEISGAKTAALLAGCRVVLYENAPHGLPFTHGERLNRDLFDFAKQ